MARKKSVNTKRTLPQTEIPKRSDTATVDVHSPQQRIMWRNSWGDEPSEYVDPTKVFAYRGPDLRDCLRYARKSRGELEYTYLAKKIGLASHNPVIGFFRGQINSEIRTVEFIMVELDCFLQYKSEVLGQDTVGVLKRVCELHGKQWLDVAHHQAGVTRDMAHAMVKRKKMPSLADVQAIMSSLNVKAVFDG